jgi:nicotinamide mononucleotide adenylyltransferase
MINDYDTVIIGLGSAQKKRDQHDPWTIEERMAMVRNVLGDRVKIVPLSDLGGEHGTDAWCNYVLKKTRDVGLPEPTDYWSGSEFDAAWYKYHFFNLHFHSNPERQHWVNVNGVDVLRKLHIMDRTQNIWPSASEIRMGIALGEQSWRQFVPAVNHEFIERTFPLEFAITAPGKGIERR